MTPERKAAIGTFIILLYIACMVIECLTGTYILLFLLFIAIFALIILCLIIAFYYSLYNIFKD